MIEPNLAAPPFLDMISALADAVAARVAPRLMPELLTVKQVADALQVSRNHVTSLIESGAIEAINVGTQEKNNWRVSGASIQAYMEARRNR